MNNWNTTVTRKGLTFHAKLSENTFGCYERVWLTAEGGAQETIHEAEFPTSNLSAASRAEYVRVMALSIADAHFRAVAK